MAGRSRSSNQLLVPGASKALQQLKYEVASELGISIGNYSSTGAMDAEFASELGSSASGGPTREYLGDLTSRDAGSLGGGITKRLIQLAEQSLRG
jgi:hypothetical protein